MFIDALVVKIRDGQVTNRPVYTAIGVTVDGERDILGLWVGNGGEGAKLAPSVDRDQEPRHPRRVHRGVRRTEGLAGGDQQHVAFGDHPNVCAAPDAQHVPVRFQSRLGPPWRGICARSTPPISEADAKERFVDFTATWGEKYPAIVRLWENAWTEFVPFLDYSPEIRKVIYSTDECGGVAARSDAQSDSSSGPLPTEQAALKCLYLVVRSLDPTGKGRKRWMNRWKAALNAFAITFEGRILPSDR